MATLHKGDNDDEIIIIIIIIIIIKVFLDIEDSLDFSICVLIFPYYCVRSDDTGKLVVGDNLHSCHMFPPLPLIFGCCPQSGGVLVI